MANRFFISPESAEMKPEREWLKRGIHLNNLIEISPVVEDHDIVGFALHINIADLAEMKYFHPVIEHMIAKATAEMMFAALEEKDPEQHQFMLSQANRISKVMLKYYEDKEASEHITDEVAEAIEQAKQSTKQ